MLDVTDLSNVHPLSDWQPHGWPCCKNVNSVHVPECWISRSMVGLMFGRRAGLRVGPLLDSTKHHKRPPAPLYKSAWTRDLRQCVFACSRAINVGTLPQGYVRNVPLPRIPLQQSTNTTSSNQVHTISDYYKVPHGAPSYDTPRSIVENAAYAFSPAWHAIAINT